MYSGQDCALCIPTFWMVFIRTFAALVAFAATSLARSISFHSKVKSLCLLDLHLVPLITRQPPCPARHPQSLGGTAIVIVIVIVSGPATMRITSAKPGLVRGGTGSVSEIARGREMIPARARGGTGTRMEREEVTGIGTRRGIGRGGRRRRRRRSGTGTGIGMMSGERNGARRTGRGVGVGRGGRGKRSGDVRKSE
jgi:hypothetical protein